MCLALCLTGKKHSVQIKKTTVGLALQQSLVGPKLYSRPAAEKPGTPLSVLPGRLSLITHCPARTAWVGGPLRKGFAP